MVLVLSILKLLLLVELVVRTLHLVRVLQTSPFVAGANVHSVHKAAGGCVVRSLPAGRVDVVVVEHRVQPLAISGSLFRVTRFSIDVLVRPVSFVEGRHLIHLILI